MEEAISLQNLYVCNVWMYVCMYLCNLLTVVGRIVPTHRCLCPNLEGCGYVMLHGKGELRLQVESRFLMR